MASSFNLHNIVRSTLLHGQLTELTTLALIPPKAPILEPGYIKETAGGNNFLTIRKENRVGNESTEDPAAAG